MKFIKCFVIFIWVFSASQGLAAFKIITAPCYKCYYLSDSNAANLQLRDSCSSFCNNASKYYKIGTSKSKDIAIILAVIGGFLGLHRFYMGHYLVGFLQLFFTMIGVLSIIAFGYTLSQSTTNLFSDLTYALSIIAMQVSFSIVAIWLIIDIVRLVTGALEPEGGFDS